MLAEKDPRLTAVVLGSYKPESWDGIKQVVNALKTSGITILTPNDLRMTTISLEDNPGFYYLASDLEEAGVTIKELAEMTSEQAGRTLNFRRLERRNGKNMLNQGANGLTYVIARENKLGKSTAYELVLAALFDNRLALNQEIHQASTELTSRTRRFIGELLPQIPIISFDGLRTLDISNQFRNPALHLTGTQRLGLMRDALEMLLRRKFVQYARPQIEFTEIGK